MTALDATVKERPLRRPSWWFVPVWTVLSMLFCLLPLPFIRAYTIDLIAESAKLNLSHNFGLLFVPGILAILICPPSTAVGQWLLLRRHVRRASFWVLCTLIGNIGAILAFFAVNQPVSTLTSPFNSTPFIVVTMTVGPLSQSLVYGIVFGAFQSLALQGRVPRAWRWILWGAPPSILVFILFIAISFLAVAGTFSEWQRIVAAVGASVLPWLLQALLMFRLLRGATRTFAMRDTETDQQPGQAAVPVE